MVHHVHSPTSRDTEDAFRNYINALIENLSLNGASRLISVSKSLEEHLRKQRFDAHKIRVVANGVPTPGPLPNRATPKADWLIGCVALFRPRKGLEVLLRAISRVRAEGKSVRLRAVGPFETPEYETHIRTLVDSLNIGENIDWIGFTEDVNAEMRRMDLFVLPSLFGEGMPMVILEAMAMGVPVVASRVEGIPEVIEPDRTGVIVPPNDSYALAKGIISIMERPEAWSSIRSRAYELQVDKYSAKSMARGVAEVYRQILKNS